MWSSAAQLSQPLELSYDWKSRFSDSMRVCLDFEINAPNPGIGPLRDLFFLNATVAPFSEEIMHFSFSVPGKP